MRRARAYAYAYVYAYVHASPGWTGTSRGEISICNLRFRLPGGGSRGGSRGGYAFGSHHLTCLRASVRLM